MPHFVPGIVPGTNRVCPWDKPGEIGLPLCRIRRKPGFVPRVFTGFVPGTNPVKSPGQTRGRPKTNRTKKLCLCAFFLPDSQASIQPCGRSPMSGYRFILPHSEYQKLSGTKIASQDRNDHGGCKQARNRSAAEIGERLRGNRNRGNRPERF